MGWRVKALIKNKENSNYWEAGKQAGSRHSLHRVGAGISQLPSFTHGGWKMLQGRG